MISFEYFKKPKKPKKDFRRPPQKDFSDYNFITDNVCRVLPHYIADNYEYFQTIPPRKFLPKNLQNYADFIKKKIAGLKSDYLL